MLSKNYLTVIIVTMLAFIFLSLHVRADMFGFLKKQDYVLSAPIKGVLLSDGKPQAGLEVVRSLTYGKEYIDKSVTDSDGRFSFPEKVIRTAKPNNMFDNTSVHQHVYIDNGTAEGIVVWYAIISLFPNSKTLVKLLGNLICDIAKEPQTYDIPIAEDKSHTFTIYTTCQL